MYNCTGSTVTTEELGKAVNLTPMFAAKLLVSLSLSHYPFFLYLTKLTFVRNPILSKFLQTPILYFTAVIPAQRRKGL